MDEEDILDRNLNEDAVRHRRYHYFQKWAKRFSWISVIILFAFVLMSGVLIPVFNDHSESAAEFLKLTAGMILTFLSLLTVSNLFSLYFRWKGFLQLARREERDYFNLLVSILFLIAPFVLILMIFGLPK